MKESVVKFIFLAALFLFASSALVYPFIMSGKERKKSNNQKAVILDLGNVVLFTDKRKAFSSFKMREIMGFLVSYGMPNESKLYECLFKVCGKDPNSEHPAVFRELFTGNIDGDSMCDKICSMLEESNLTKIQKNFVCSCIENMRPERLSDIMYLDKQAANFICELLNSVDENGEPIRVIILSNWDKESFRLIRQKFSFLFDLIGDENIIVSGNIGLMKPDLLIYRYLLIKYDLIPEKCFFVDDTRENVVSARKCGIRSVVHKGWNKTPYKLRKLGLEYKTKADSSEIEEQALACQ